MFTQTGLRKAIGGVIGGIKILSVPLAAAVYSGHAYHVSWMALVGGTAVWAVLQGIVFLATWAWYDSS